MFNKDIFQIFQPSHYTVWVVANHFVLHGFDNVLKCQQLQQEPPPPEHSVPSHHLITQHQYVAVRTKLPTAHIQLWTPVAPRTELGHDNL